MHPAAFILSILVPLILTVTIQFGFELWWIPVVFIFIGIPILDAIIGTHRYKFSDEQADLWKKPSFYLVIPYLYTAVQFILFAVYSYQASQETSLLHVVIYGFVFGLLSGGVGITVAHELCHKKEAVPRVVADLLLISVCYQHFVVEHVRGHHLRVATKDDPASARPGESFYHFYFRSVSSGFTSAWEIEERRLKGRVWKLENQVIQGMLGSLGFMVLLTILGGGQVLFFFLVQSVVAFSLLEAVNYIEHYGLTRRQKDNRHYEKVSIIHSWNSSHFFSNAVLFNLQRHSDHHAYAHLPYTILKDHAKSPQLPSGYPGMILLALFPHFWFKVMDKKIYAWKKEYQTSISA